MRSTPRGVIAPHGLIDRAHLRAVAPGDGVDERGAAVGIDGHRFAPPSPEIISAFEQEFGISLPLDYVSLLMYSNGGHPELDSIAPMERKDIAMRAINVFFYLKEDQEGPAGLWAAARAWQPTLGEKQIPIAADGGGNPFILDMSTAPPTVSTCLHEESFARVEIAASFSEFIDGLEFDPDMI